MSTLFSEMEKGNRMNQVKFALMIREFPFLAKVLEQQHLSFDSTGTIAVRRGDRNLLEVVPCYESHDIGEHGDYTKMRRFWVITDSGMTIALRMSVWHSQSSHGTKQDDRAASIETQLLGFANSLQTLRQVTHIVELHGEEWDVQIEQWHVVVYKMENFDWQPLLPRQPVLRIVG